VVKSHGGERWGKSAKKHFAQVSVREVNASKPSDDLSITHIFVTNR